MACDFYMEGLCVWMMEPSSSLNDGGSNHSSTVIPIPPSEQTMRIQTQHIQPTMSADIASPVEKPLHATTCTSCISDTYNDHEPCNLLSVIKVLCVRSKPNREQPREHPPNNSLSEHLWSIPPTLCLFKSVCLLYNI